MDNETGETVQPQLSEAMLDMETGELTSEETEIKPIGIRKAKFSVPKQYLSKPLPKKPKNKCGLTYSLTSKEKVLELKEEIILGYNRTSHRLFLIPSLFFFPRFAAIILVIAEIWLHVYSHKKNRQENKKDVYYMSPLHSLTSQFCSSCLEKRKLPIYTKKTN